MTTSPHLLAARRRAGVLLHISSLPSGTLGEDAFKFVDFLAASGFTIWQILPTCPTDEGGSPYSSSSAFAGNPDFIDKGFLDREPYYGYCDLEADSELLWQQAYRVFAQLAQNEQQAFRDFVQKFEHWLVDFAHYVLLKRRYVGAWVSWPELFRQHDSTALQQFSGECRQELQAIYFQQYIFFQQWQALKHYANERGVLIVGDVPIFVAHDSADCWSHQDLFLLDELGQPKVVAGVPPDYFSETGQRWGNPQYDWETMAAQQFKWWIERFRYSFTCFDLVRVDHFRGFQASWFIPGNEELAINGHWQLVPGKALFDELATQLGHLPIIAEDLGLITPEVEQLRDELQLPGMKILQFAFDGSADNPYLPENHIAHSVVFTGTHDNDTIMGWFGSLSQHDQHRVLACLGGGKEEMPWLMIRVALQSVANTVIVPMQDLLALGSKDRMNTPGTVQNNWGWRLKWAQLTDDIEIIAKHLNQLTGRCEE